MYSKARGKHGMKETSTEKYSKSLKRKFQSLMGTPKWADLDQKKIAKDDEDSDDEFFRVRRSSTYSGSVEDFLFIFRKQPTCWNRRRHRKKCPRECWSSAS
jgi:hypothetical protein